MQFKRISLTDKFVILFIAMGVIAAGTVSMITYFLARDALMKRTFDQLTSVKSVKKEQMESFFRDRFEDLDYLTGVISYSVRSYPEKYLRDENAGITEYLDEYIGRSKFYSKYYYLTVDEIKNGDEYPGKLMVYNKPFVRDMNYRVPGRPLMLVFGAPVFRGADKIGILLLEVDPTPINKIMLNKNPGTGLGESGESYLVGDDYLLRSNSRFRDSTVMQVAVETIGARRALSGISGTNVFLDYRGIEVLSSYCLLDIPDLKWALMAEIDLKEAMAPIDKIRNYILFLTVSISLFVFILAYFISKRISQPLKTLTSATERIGQGDFDVIVKTESQDEIGDLTESFNIMSDQLREKDRALQNERLKQSTIATDAQDKERERLSRELHDGIGQTLIAIKLKLEQYFNSSDSGADSMADNIRNAIDGSIEEVRSMSNTLTPSVLTVFGFENAVRKICNDLKEYGDYEINYNYSYPDEIKDKKAKTYLYRIVQEAFNNIHKHSGADTVDLSITENKGQLQMIISDNGKGFENEEGYSGNGAGLYNMSERAKILGGSCTIDAKPDRGVTVTVTVPAKALEMGETE